MGTGPKDTLEDAIQSDCFYSVYGAVDTVDLLKYDFQNIVGDGQVGWFNVMAYDPLHITGDLSVSYQYCGGGNQLTNVTSFFSADYAFISQSVSNQATYLITEFSNLGERFKEAQYEAEIPFGDLTDCFHGLSLQA